MGLFDKIKGSLGSRDTTAPAVKPGRNEPCWCGSGKKYKKCHLSEEERKASERSCALNCGST